MHEQSRQLISAELDVGRGDLSSAERRLAVSQQLSMPGFDGSMAASVLATYAAHVAIQLRLARRDLAGARRAESEGIAAFGRLGTVDRVFCLLMLPTALRVEVELAALARARGDEDALGEARQRGRAILDLPRALERDLKAGGSRVAPSVIIAAALCEAEWARLEGTPDPPRWAEAAAACRDAEQLAIVPYALFRQAEAMLERRGDHATAAALLREAFELAASMGARPLQEEIEALARRARVALEPAEGAPRDVGSQPSAALASLQLTPREREILALVAIGRTNRQIAEELFISESTAGVHVSHIIGKLGVSNRVEAAAIAHRLGVDGPSRSSQAPVGS
jgi:DNA-binding CsgD family transcriptional regulator